MLLCPRRLESYSSYLNRACYVKLLAQQLAIKISHIGFWQYTITHVCMHLIMCTRADYSLKVFLQSVWTELPSCTQTSTTWWDVIHLNVQISYAFTWLVHVLDSYMHLFNGQIWMWILWPCTCSRINMTINFVVYYMITHVNYLQIVHGKYKSICTQLVQDNENWYLAGIRSPGLRLWKYY